MRRYCNTDQLDEVDQVGLGTLLTLARKPFQDALYFVRPGGSMQPQLC